MKVPPDSAATIRRIRSRRLISMEKMPTLRPSRAADMAGRHREGRLPHARAGSQDHQSRAAQASQQLGSNEVCVQFGRVTLS